VIQAYDVAVVRLNGTSLAQPVQLYQGGCSSISFVCVNGRLPVCESVAVCLCLCLCPCPCLCLCPRVLCVSVCVWLCGFGCGCGLGRVFTAHINECFSSHAHFHKGKRLPPPPLFNVYLKRTHTLSLSGGDLGISDCKSMKLSYVSWNLNTDYLPSAGACAATYKSTKVQY
jgi:hypothetical protein